MLLVFVDIHEEILIYVDISVHYIFFLVKNYEFDRIINCLVFYDYTALVVVLSKTKNEMLEVVFVSISISYNINTYYSYIK